MSDEYARLAAENFALYVVLAKVLQKLSARDAVLAEDIRAALDSAASFVEDRAIATGRHVTPKYSVKAIEVVEDLRATVFPDEDKPRHGV